MVRGGMERCGGKQNILYHSMHARKLRMYTDIRQGEGEKWQGYGRKTNRKHIRRMGRTEESDGGVL